jgi:hypothetical protein
MSPITHFFTGWVLSNSANLSRRERALVTAAGVVPDIDGLGIIAEVLTRTPRIRWIGFPGTTTRFTTWVLPWW